MQEYAKICLLVSVFAAVRELRPVEPFFTAFLSSPFVNLTTQQVNQNVYPFGTYSCLANVIVVFLVTDYLCYKPVIIFGSFSGVLIYTLLLFNPPLWRIQISQLFFGFFSAAHVAYFSYMYARIEDKRLYQKVTGYARASLLLGKFFNGAIAQLSISSGILNYSHLLYLSVAGTIITFSIGIFFPPVQHSIYFHKKKFKTDQIDGYDEIGNSQEFKASDESGETQETGINSPRQTLTDSTKNQSAVSHLWHDYKAAFSNSTVIRWSLWMVFAKGCHFMVLTYIQLLWQTVAKERASVPLMNGAVEAVYTIISAAASYTVAKMSSDWRRGHIFFLFCSCLCSGGLLFYLSISTNLWLIYVAYVTYGFIFQSTLTITESQIAQNLQRDSYALIFGFLNFSAFILTSLFTILFVQSTIFELNVHQQFGVYGIYFLVLGGVVAFGSVFPLCRRTGGADMATREIASPS